MAAALSDTCADPEGAFSLDYDEAWIRLMLGDTARARALLRRMERARPALAAYLSRDPLARLLGAPR